MLPKHLLLLRQIFTIISIAFCLVVGSDLPGSVQPSKEFNVRRESFSGANIVYPRGPSTNGIAEHRGRSGEPARFGERSIQGSPGSSLKSEPMNPAGSYSTSYIKEPIAWFGEFDRIRRSAEPTEQEKRAGNSLLLRALAGGSNLPDNVELTKILRKMKRRYQIATGAIDRLPALNSELKSLRDGYSGYFSASEDLCGVCIETASRAALDQERLRDLVEQKGLISDLAIEFDRADAMVRAKYGVARYDANPEASATSIAARKRSGL